MLASAISPMLSSVVAVRVREEVEMAYPMKEELVVVVWVELERAELGIAVQLRGCAHSAEPFH